MVVCLAASLNGLTQYVADGGCIFWNCGSDFHGQKAWHIDLWSQAAVAAKPLSPSLASNTAVSSGLAKQY